MRKSKKSCFGVLILGALAIVLLVAAKIGADTTFYDGYDANLPLQADVVEQARFPEYQWQEFAFDGVAGVRVPSVIAVPHGSGPFPSIIFLHGIGQSKSFLKEIAAPFVESGFAIVSFDQYTRGDRKLDDNANGLEEALAMRRRGALTVIETRRMVDYLASRPDMAADRIYLVGASYGAITGATAAALEPRIAAVVLVYGGGDLKLLLPSKEAKAYLKDWTNFAVTMGATFFAPSDPIYYVDQISPRPILFQNGRNDSIIPAAAAEALYSAAKDPKEIIWYESDHVGLDIENTRQVLEDARAWLAKQDMPRRTP